MEQNIKNFDRGIEQKMNEHEVAPPFGMWNRISSELDAMPIAAAAPIATSLIPKRAMMGIIATALVIGTAMITGYLVSSSLNKNTVAPTGNTSIEATTKSATSTAPVQQTVRQLAWIVLEALSATAYAHPMPPSFGTSGLQLGPHIFCW